jgi:hypothetical protein
MGKSACSPILTELSRSLYRSGERCHVSCIRRAVALQLARIITETFFTNTGLVHEVSAEPNCARQWRHRVSIHMTLPPRVGEAGDVHEITRSG